MTPHFQWDPSVSAAILPAFGHCMGHGTDIRVHSDQRDKAPLPCSRRHATIALNTAHRLLWEEDS